MSIRKVLSVNAVVFGLAAMMLGTTLVANAQGVTAPVPARAEAALIRENWAVLVGNSASSPMKGPEAKFIEAHALLALNRGNEAVCLFATLLGPEDLQRWSVWAGRFAERHPEAAVAHYLHGDSLARLGQWEGAMRAFQSALDRNPKHSLTLNARGVSFAVIGDLSRALLDLQNASPAGSLFADAYISKGYLYIQRHVAAGARSAFERALQLAPDSGLALSGRGYVAFAEGKWGAGKSDLQAAAGRCSCLASLFAGNMAQATRWAESRTLVARAGRPGEDVGTTINSVLMRVGQGDRNAVTEVLRLGAENPDQQKKISLTLQSMANTNPVAKAAIGTAINDFAVKAQDRVDTLEAAKGITVKGQVGAGGNIGVAKVDGQLGVTADLSKSLDQQSKQANQSLDFAKSIQSAVPAAKEQVGGVTTSMAAAALDNGDWPIRPHYSLLYPSGAAYREERSDAK